MNYLISFEKFNRMNDHFLKFLFSNPKNKHFTIALINAIFAELNLGKILDITFKDKEQVAEHVNDKTSAVDVLVEDKDLILLG